MRHARNQHRDEPVRAAESGLAAMRWDGPKRILMVTDAWRPQVNGVVHTLERLAETLTTFGVEVDFLTPEPLPHPAAADLSGHPAGADHAAAMSRG